MRDLTFSLRHNAHASCLLFVRMFWVKAYALVAVKKQQRHANRNAERTRQEHLL